MSAIKICSNALLNLGANPINSFIDNSDHARLCANLYPSVRDALLRRHPWNCAVKRVVLAPQASKPEFDYGYRFLLPSDCLRILSVDTGQTLDYRVEGQYILANSNVVRLRYVFRNEDESTWDAALIQLAELFMTARIAYPVTASASMKESCSQEAEFALRQAKAVDAQEEPAQTLDGYPILASRF